MTPEEEATLRAENTALREQVQQLLAEVQDLKERLATAHQDSHNSSKPPSSDGLKRKPKSLREHRRRRVHRENVARHAQ